MACICMSTKASCSHRQGFSKALGSSMRDPGIKDVILGLIHSTIRVWVLMWGQGAWVKYKRQKESCCVTACYLLPACSVMSLYCATLPGSQPITNWNFYKQWAVINLPSFNFACKVLHLSNEKTKTYVQDLRWSEHYYSETVIPNLFGTRDQFHERQSFCGPDWESGKWFQDDWSTWHLLWTLLLLLHYNIQ